MEWFATRLDSRSGGTVMMAGEAGIGKSRLLGELLARATAAGYVTAVGVCPGEGETPVFGPWQEALDDYAAATGRSLTPLPPPFGEGEHRESISGHAVAVARFLSAGPGAVLGLEDIHWADSGSLDLLRHLAGRLAGGPVQVVATYKADALHRDHPLYAILPMLDRSGAHRMTLGRLSEAEVQELARAAGHPEMAGSVYSRSGGNPFFARELLAVPHGVMPETVQQAIDRRLSHLSPNALAALQAAAVLGQECDFETLRGVLGQTEEQVLQALEEAMTLRLIQEQGDHMLFDHALVREVLYAGLVGPRRREWHRRAAREVRDHDAVAHHLERAADPAAVPYLWAAGERALRLGSRAEAAAHYDRALALIANGDPRRPELLLLAAFAYRIPDPRRADAYIDEALRTATDRGDQVVRAMALHSRAVRLQHDRDDRAVPTMEQAHRELTEVQDDPRLHALEELISGGRDPVPGRSGGLAIIYLNDGRPAKAEALAAALVAQPGRATTGRANAHLALAWCAWSRGEVDVALAHFRQSSATSQERRNYFHAARQMADALQVALTCRGTDRAEISAVAARLQEITRLAEEYAGQGPFTGCSPLFSLWFWQGEWDLARREVDAFRSGEWLWLDLWAAALACEQGDLEAARSHLREIVPLGGPGSAPRYSEYHHEMLAMTLMARICRYGGDLHTARAWLQTVDEWHRSPRPSPHNHAYNLLEWAAWYQEEGNRIAAHKAAAAALEFGISTGSTFVLVRAHRLLGALGGLRAQQHLARALDLAQRAGYLYEEALARLERRTPEDLLAARAILERLGARPALAWADSALTHVGPQDGAGLTPRQLDIVRLVTQGLTDREIGARLHISVRTVDTHLRNIFGKTGVASRSGLVAWAARQGLIEDA